MKKIVLIGAGGHCKVIIDIIKSINEFEIVGITDKLGLYLQNKNRNLGYVVDVPIIGDDSILDTLYMQGVEYAFVCIGALTNIEVRYKLFEKLKKIGFIIPVLVHKNATISSYAEIKEGTCIMAGAVINAGAKIGENCIINTGAIVEHDCYIDKNTHISPNACLCGEVTIGYNTHIGAGSTVLQGIDIGNNVTIGAGAVVVNDIGDSIKAVGVPAKIIDCR